MNPLILASALSGREYGLEITDDEAAEAAKHGIVVMYGAEDDTIVLRGAIEAQVVAFGGIDIYIDKDGLIPSLEDVRKDYNLMQFFVWGARLATSVMVKARWDCEGFAWSFFLNDFGSGVAREDIGVVFHVYENGEPFSRGLCFNLSEIGDGLC